MSSLYAAATPLRGLTDGESIETLVDPLLEVSEIKAALGRLEGQAWYLFKGVDQRVFFGQTANVTAEITDIATNIAVEQVDQTLREKLRQVFKPRTGNLYSNMAILPGLDEIELDDDRPTLIVLERSADQLPQDFVACSHLYAARQPGAGFLKTILLRRIGSSAQAGLETARHLLGRIEVSLPEEEIGDEGLPTNEAPPDPREVELLREVERNLAAVVGGSDIDPKVQVILHYLGERNWLEHHGAIIFSQYRTTAEWVLEALCAAYPDEPVALYAGGVASFVQRGNDRRSAKREHIKKSIQRSEIRLVCATDAACEGLNLQSLGAQINVDLPWNPSRLEQRKGRVQRIGQIRDEVHILSLRYAGTVEDQVYATLPSRFGDIFSVLGQLPDGFEDQWIDAVLRDRDSVKNFSQRVEKERPPMELRYMKDIADDHGLDWEYTERVLSSRDLDEWMRQGW